MLKYILPSGIICLALGNSLQGDSSGNKDHHNTILVHNNKHHHNYKGSKARSVLRLPCGANGSDCALNFSCVEAVCVPNQVPTIQIPPLPNVDGNILEGQVLDGEVSNGDVGTYTEESLSTEEIAALDNAGTAWMNQEIVEDGNALPLLSSTSSSTISDPNMSSLFIGLDENYVPVISTIPLSEDFKFVEGIDVIQGDLDVNGLEITTLATDSETVTRKRANAISFATRDEFLKQTMLDQEKVELSRGTTPATSENDWIDFNGDQIYDLDGDGKDDIPRTYSFLQISEKEKKVLDLSLQQLKLCHHEQGVEIKGFPYVLPSRQAQIVLQASQGLIKSYTFSEANFVSLVLDCYEQTTIVNNIKQKSKKIPLYIPEDKFPEITKVLAQTGLNVHAAQKLFSKQIEHRVRIKEMEENTLKSTKDKTLSVEKVINLEQFAAHDEKFVMNYVKQNPVAAVGVAASVLAEDLSNQVSNNVNSLANSANTLANSVVNSAFFKVNKLSFLSIASNWELFTFKQLYSQLPTLVQYFCAEYLNGYDLAGNIAIWIIQRLQGVGDAVLHVVGADGSSLDWLFHSFVNAIQADANLSAGLGVIIMIKELVSIALYLGLQNNIARRGLQLLGFDVKLKECWFDSQCVAISERTGSLNFLCDNRPDYRFGLLLLGSAAAIALGTLLPASLPILWLFKSALSIAVGGAVGQIGGKIFSSAGTYTCGPLHIVSEACDGFDKSCKSGICFNFFCVCDLNSNEGCNFGDIHNSISLPYDFQCKSETNSNGASIFGAFPMLRPKPVCKDTLPKSPYQILNVDENIKLHGNIPEEGKFYSECTESYQCKSGCCIKSRISSYFSSSGYCGPFEDLKNSFFKKEVCLGSVSKPCKDDSECINVSIEGVALSVCQKGVCTDGFPLCEKGNQQCKGKVFDGKPLTRCVYRNLNPSDIYGTCHDDDSPTAIIPKLPSPALALKEMKQHHHANSHHKNKLK